MAKLLLGNSLKKAADRMPVLKHFLWGIEALVIGAFFGICALLSPDRASAAGRWLFRLAGPHLDKTRIFRRNLSLAFPDKSMAEIEGLIREIWGNVGAVLAEYPHLQAIASDTTPQRTEVVIEGGSRVFRQSGKPAVFVAAHLSNWELPPAAGVKLGLPVSVVYTPLQNPWLDRMLYRAREKMGFSLVPRDGGMRTLIRELSRGRSIGLVVDQRVDEGEPVPFFGIDMNTTITPARLALRYDCELIPIRVERLNGARFRVTFHAPVTAPEGVTDEHRKMLAMTRKVNDLFEAWITENPQDWLCSKRRWPKDATPP